MDFFVLKSKNNGMVCITRGLLMIMNFEENVYYFTELVFNNIQSAKVKKNKRKEVFKYLKIKSNGNKIVVNSKRLY